MSCCGQKRAAVASLAMQGRGPGAFLPAAKPVPARTPEAGLGPGGCRVRYAGAHPLSLRGARSGRVYYFAETGETTVIDEKDFEALLRTGLFVRDPDGG